MRRTLIIALVVLVLSAGICVIGQAAINHAVHRECQLIDAAANAVMFGDRATARTLTHEIAAYWEARLRALALLTAHKDLYEVREGIADAALCLEYGDQQECLRVLLSTGIALQGLMDAEAVCWENIF